MLPSQVKRILLCQAPSGEHVEPKLTLFSEPLQVTATGLGDGVGLKGDGDGGMGEGEGQIVLVTQVLQVTLVPILLHLPRRFLAAH